LQGQNVLAVPAAKRLKSDENMIAQDRGLAVSEALRVSQIIEHKETGRDRMKTAEGRVRP